MNDTSEQADVVVIGAGVIGCATARELAPDHDVVVIEQGQIAGDTTGKASGLVTTAASYHPYPDLAKHTIEFFREYDGTGEFSFTERPRIGLTPAGEDEAARRTAAEAREGGFETHYHTRSALEERYPGVFDLPEDYAGGIEYRDTGWVDPYTYTMTLADDAMDAGAEFRTNTAVETVRVDDGEVRGVETEDGSIAAPAVVCAAGWRTRPLLSDVVEVPVYPFRWQTLDIDPGRDVADFPMGYDPLARRYWRPEHNGNLHVGGGEYRVEKPGAVRERVREGFRTRTAREFPTRFADLGDARIIAGDTCPTGDATTPDKFPIMDAPVPGLVVSTGYHIGGIMTSPAAATAARALLTDGGAPFDVEAFSLDRFESRSTDYEFVGLMEDHTALEEPAGAE